MILPNNPRVDTAQLAAHVAMLGARRRRTQIAAASCDAPIGAQAGAQATSGATAANVSPVGSVPAHCGPCGGAAANGTAPATAAAPSAERLAGTPAVPPSPTVPAGGWRAGLKAIPLVGRVAVLLRALLRLPRFQRSVVDVHDALRAELRSLGVAQQRGLAAQAELRDAQAELRTAQAQSIRQLEARCGALEARLVSQTRAIRQLERALSASAPVPAAPAGTPVGPVQAPATPGTVPDGFYVDFEDRFRGSREAVMARQRQYLPHVLEAVRGRSAANCVDIGCGRGEWLELLAGQGIRAVGIDLDPGMAREALRAGLDARTGDGIEWLEQQPPDSVDVVTAFHVIEHLPFDRLLRLLDAVLRALSPGGVAIFETPNPENLLVATNSFHLDPTHRHPIPPPLAEFLAQQRGFGRAELLRLNPLPAQMHVRGDDELTRRVNQLLYGAQDYALVAWKQSAAVRAH